MSENQHFHQLVLKYQRHSKKYSLRTSQVFFDFCRPQDVLAVEFRPAFSKHNDFCFRQVANYKLCFFKKNSRTFSHRRHSKLASVCNKELVEPDLPC